MAQNETAPLTTYRISRYLHVDLTTVINWCEMGKLKAYKTPGGHRRVQSDDFLEFLKQYKMPIPKEFKERMEGALKILIVDDEEPLRRFLRRTLTRHIPQAELFEAQDGFEAGKFITDKLPHLVILDLRIPGVDGFRVCANIREDSRFKNTKILAITGYGTNENRERILKAGADDYLPKPFEAKSFIAKVFKLLNLVTVPKENTHV